MSESKTTSRVRFLIGDLVQHELFHYRGVVIGADPQFEGTDEWYETVARSRPPKDRPWYHVLPHGATHQTYVADRNLQPDHSVGAGHPPSSKLPTFQIVPAPATDADNEREMKRLEHRETGMHIRPHNLARGERGVGLDWITDAAAAEDRNRVGWLEGVLDRAGKRIRELTDPIGEQRVQETWERTLPSIASSTFLRASARLRTAERN